MFRWTDRHDEWLRNMYPDTSNRTIAKVLGCSYSAVKNRGQLLGLKKSAEYLEREKPGCFRKGQPTWNKGLSYQPGGRTKESQFRPGQKPSNTAPIGAETEDKDGYLKRKVRDDAPAGMSRKNWKFVHVLKWEEYHGVPVPAGHVIRFRNGDKRDFSEANLVLVSMAENAVLNKFFAMAEPPEGGFEVLLNLARIQLAIGKRKREAA